MAKFQFDKKQLVPAAAMGVVSAGLFVYFVWKMTTPPPIQAAAPAPTTQTASAQGAKPGQADAKSDATPGSLVDGTATNDPLLGAPQDNMRDPFTPAIVDTSNLPGRPFQVASSKTDLGTVPGIPHGLPTMGGIPPMPLAPGSRLPGPGADTGPQWTVTGVLSDASEPHNRVAILRSGDTRRFVRLGDMVDGTFRLIDVSRTGVVLANGSHHIRLPLGGYKKPEAQHSLTLSGADTGPWQGEQGTGAPAQPGDPTQTGQPQPGTSQASPDSTPFGLQPVKLEPGANIPDQPRQPAPPQITPGPGM